MDILALCGSLNSESSNLKLLKNAKERAPIGSTVEIVDLLRDLPHFNSDVPDDHPPAAVGRWREKLLAADGVLIASPEYGHSLPGVLKNGIDWVIQTGELYQKVVAITCATRSPERGLLGLQALKTTLLAVDARIAWEAPILSGPESDTQLDALLTHLVEIRRESLQ